MAEKYAFPGINYRWVESRIRKDRGCAYTTYSDSDKWFYSCEFVVSSGSPFLSARKISRHRKRKDARARAIRLAKGERRPTAKDRQVQTDLTRAYCVAERRHVNVERWESKRLANGKLASIATCPSCFKQIMRFGIPPRLCPGCDELRPPSHFASDDYLCKACRS